MSILVFLFLACHRSWYRSRIDSSDTATTYSTGLIWSQFRLWLLRKQHTV